MNTQQYVDFPLAEQFKGLSYPTDPYRGISVKDNNYVFGGYHCHYDVSASPFERNKLPPKHLIIQDSFADYDMPREMQFIECKDKTISRFTGCFAKGNIPIYEYDIVKNQYNSELVCIFEDGCFCFISALDYIWGERQGDYYPLFNAELESTEIIGTIFDNEKYLNYVNEYFYSFKEDKKYLLSNTLSPYLEEAIKIYGNGDDEKN